MAIGCNDVRVFCIFDVERLEEPIGRLVLTFLVHISGHFPEDRHLLDEVLKCLDVD